MSLGGNQQLQELAQQIQELEQQKEAVQGEIEALRAEQTEIDEAVEAIEKLDTDSTVQVPLGGGAYVRATVEDIKEIIVDLGADYAAERDEAGAVSTLESKRDTLDERIEDLQSEIAEIETETQDLESRAQQMQQQQMQQQMQGMQQQESQDE
jgi:prefoldin alpha subunit